MVWGLQVPEHKIWDNPEKIAVISKMHDFGYTSVAKEFMNTHVFKTLLLDQVLKQIDLF